MFDYNHNYIFNVPLQFFVSNHFFAHSYMVFKYYYLIQMIYKTYLRDT